MSAARVTTHREKGFFAGPKGRYRKTTLLAYSFLLPSVVILIVFHFIGMFYGFFISLHNWGLISEGFIGLDNYVRALSADSALWQAITVTFFYALCVIPIQLPLALVVAYLLFQPIRGRDAFRVLYFLPYITSTVAGAAVWEWILDPYNGVLNFALEKVGIQAFDTIRWLQEPRGLVEILFNTPIVGNPQLMETIPGGWGNLVSYLLAGPSL
ncbi:MAG: sugar ABC transporter permease, partial [Chloroflexi bacterium]|nr:sugar ABC transporter permease [Chloroflexota bacterium]